MKEEMLEYKQQFNDHYKNAKKRGIEFQFTYEEWVAWWGDDITARGNKQGQLVMARHGDIGPYHPDNVRKATQEENRAEARQFKKWSPKTIQLTTKDGTFKSITECAQFYKKNKSTILRALRNNSKKYGFIKE